VFVLCYVRASFSGTYVYTVTVYMMLRFCFACGCLECSYSIESVVSRSAETCSVNYKNDE
jgi:hypothetical protein